VLVMFPFFRRASRFVMITAVTAAAISVLGLLIQIFPGLDQVNGDIIGLTLPANLGMAVALYLAHQRLRKKLPTPEPHAEIQTAV